MKNEKKISSIEQIREQKRLHDIGEELELPSGLVVRARRPNTSKLIISGAIPQELLSLAIKFQNGEDMKNIEEVKQSMQVIAIIMKEAIAEPQLTIQDVDDLDDIDKTFLMSYIQRGVKDVEFFRKQFSGENSRPNMPQIPRNKAKSIS